VLSDDEPTAWSPDNPFSSTQQIVRSNLIEDLVEQYNNDILLSKLFVKFEEDAADLI